MNVKQVNRADVTTLTIVYVNERIKADDPSAQFESYCDNARDIQYEETHSINLSTFNIRRCKSTLSCSSEEG